MEKLSELNAFLKYNTGNDNLGELFRDALLHPSKIILALLAPFMRLVLWAHSVKFQKNIILYGTPRIDNKGEISIGRGTRLVSHSNAYTSGNLVGPVFLRAKKNARIVIGNDVCLNGTMLVAETWITIGDRTIVGANTLISDTDNHNLEPLNRGKRWDKIRTQPIEIGEDVFIGSCSIILKGVIIGRGSVIGAGSVVTSNVPENSIYAGNPAKFIKNVDPLG